METIVITTTSFGEYNRTPLKLLKENGLKFVLNPYKRKLDKEKIIELCEKAIGIIAGTETIDADILKKLNKLRVISRCGTGIENVDLEAAKKKKIKVFNTPDVPTRPVAELTVGLLLSLLRKIHQMDSDIKDGKWEKKMGNLLYGKRVGIIGFGRIGQKVGELLSGFDVEIAYYDVEKKSASFNCAKMGFKEILSWSDIVSLHLAPAAKSGHIIGEKEIGLMKKGGWIVNASRGDVIDEGALYKALKEGYLTGAAIDVYEEEPYNGKMRDLENVLLTPHIGSYAKEARIEMEKQAVENLLKGLQKYERGKK